MSRGAGLSVEPVHDMSFERATRGGIRSAQVAFARVAPSGVMSSRSPTRIERSAYEAGLPGGASCVPVLRLRTGTKLWYRPPPRDAIRPWRAASRGLPMSRITLPPASIAYPSGDGKPTAENDAQLAVMLYAIGALRVYYRDRADVYVSGDLLMYYEKGNPRVSVAPDVFVAFGVEDRVREHYLVWKEGKAPDFVLEVASKSTWREDLGPKRGLYARLGVKEYWQYDPRGKYFTPVLQGLRLAGGAYVRQLAVTSPDGALTLTSETLELELRAQGGEMRFRDPVTGQTLLSYSETVAARREEAAARRTEAAARRAAESRAEREAAARQAAEARVAELEALLGET